MRLPTGIRQGIIALCAGVSCAVAGIAVAEPLTYDVDPHHTYPSFEADHMGGLSKWRGKFNKSSGRIVLDREARDGSVDITIDTSSIDFGHEELNEHARGADLFDVRQYPTATYKGKLVKFEEGVPTAIEGVLTLRGVSRPVDLEIDSFLCKPHPLTQKEVCGADARGSIDRSAFGIGLGKDMGFDMNTVLAIQVEAIRAD